MWKRLSVVISLVLMVTITSSVVAEPAGDNMSRLQAMQQKWSVAPPANEQREYMVNRCLSGQSQFTKLQAAGDNATTKRLIAYSAIQKEVKAIELRMTKQGADASEIDLFIGKLQQNIDSFTEQSRYSQQIAQDIQTISCTNNPELYTAAIVEYSDVRRNLYNIATDLKNTIITAPQDTFAPLIGPRSSMQQRHSLVWPIVGTVVISTVLVSASFLFFLNSGAYTTVKQISAAAQALQNKLDGIDTTSPIQATDIEEYAQDLPQRVQTFDDAEDYGPINL